MYQNYVIFSDTASLKTQNPDYSYEMHLRAQKMIVLSLPAFDLNNLDRQYHNENHTDL